ncbi:uncharacterized protein LOC134260340 [Saccostrea cucullata]|uniref:uncharacterized protein LOC134260340 n=1 Tax=Saccostrea cuccullata TaxID=36930 RepID=UPI002ED46911
MKEDRIREMRGYQEEIKNTQQLLLETVRQNRKIVEFVCKHLCCTGTEEVWVSYDKKARIQRKDIRGSIGKTFRSICMHWSGYPSRISVTRKGELVGYTDKQSKTVYTYQDGRHFSLIMVQQGWQPIAVYCTKSGDFLVCLKTVDDRVCKIVRYKGQTIIQEMAMDNRGDPLYKGGNKMLYVTENINGDVVASDCNAKFVVVVNCSGALRYHSKGDKSIKGKFTPGSIVTDSKGRTLVEDDGNSCIQIIDQDGQYLKHLNYCGILSLDTLGRLWVGKVNGNKVNVIKYTE